MINEIGNPIGFELKKLLHESRKMKSELYPNNIFFFSISKNYYGTCICKIDFMKKHFFIHRIILLDFFENSELKAYDIIKYMSETVIDEYSNYELEMMDEWDHDMFETDLKKHRYQSIHY